VDCAAAALLELGRELRRADYDFVTPTPETHRRVNARAAGNAASASGGARDALREVFGWNRAFEPARVPRGVLDLMRSAGVIAECGERLRSRVRFARLRGLLFAHSAFPTEQADAVFFGPDTYRFCALLQRWAPRARRVADVGCGSGAGGISLAPRAEQCVLSDVNPRALQLARVNAALNDVRAEVVTSDVLGAVGGDVDLIVANPPYMRDGAGRLYRDGGGAHGEGLSVRIVREGLARLARGGTLIVYTGSAIVDGADTFRRAVEPALLEQRSARIDYEELDPDVFGEELERPGHAGVERIAVVGLRVALN
jgi:methylase of polypeptide subunit release factors